jgi:hypothetical protein
MKADHLAAVRRKLHPEIPDEKAALLEEPFRAAL